MPIYKFKCYTCDEEFENIEKMGTEIAYCPICEKLGGRMHGQELSSPPKLVAGVGGFHSPSYGDRKYG